MARKAASFKVEFLPSKKSTTVPGGTVLVDAAARAGILIDTPCGGQGRCGRCLVRVEKGSVSNNESPYLTHQQIQQGWALSCMARVAGDMVISVPTSRERDKISAGSAASREASAIQLDWPLSPTVRQLFLELSAPGLEDSTADFDRLKSAIQNSYDIANLTASLPLLRKLSPRLRKSRWQLTATVDNRLPDEETRLINIHRGHRKQAPLGIALDIGTTNIAAALVNLNSGSILGRISAMNRQRSCGEDIISRIIYSERKGGLKQLNRLVIHSINDLIAELCRRSNIGAGNIDQVVAAGNTTMTHLLLSLPPVYIRQEPYIPTATRFPPVTARELGIKINPDAIVYCVPAVAAYIGGDTSSGVLSSGLFRDSRLSLFLDIGTNGEMVLGNSDWMIACACSAGPAFEGAGVSCGMAAISGAIEEITINSTSLEPVTRTIDDTPPAGICGSGMICALAEMLNTGIVDKAGHINQHGSHSSYIRAGEHGAEYVLCRAADSVSGRDIALNEVDINNLIRTKAAIYAGITVMLNKLDIPPSQVEQVLIGGAFGQHINIARAIQIGLLPALPWERFRYLGNSSLSGAYNILLSREAQQQAEDIASKITCLELIADNEFMDELTAASFLPHTDSSKFPSTSEYTHDRSNRA